MMDDDRFEYMDDHLLPQPVADDVPVRIWANIELDEEGETFIEFLSDEPWSEDNPGVEYVKANPWQEMYNAPHDGTDILAWDGNSREVLFWSKYGNGWTNGNPKIKHNPIRWMPLPDPPNPQDVEG
jgi:hypothetical protein